MKVIIEFDSIEDRHDLKMHQQCTEMYLALNDFAEWLRAKCKYGDEESIKFEDLREEFHNIINERDVKLDL